MSYALLLVLSLIYAHATQCRLFCCKSVVLVHISLQGTGSHKSSTFSKFRDKGSHKSSTFSEFRDNCNDSNIAVVAVYLEKVDVLCKDDDNDDYERCFIQSDLQAYRNN